MSGRTLVDGLVFPEAPRWREGHLWFSDIWDDRVARVRSDGRVDTEAELDQPSGLGWLPDGRLLVVAMGRRQLLRREHDGMLSRHADLAEFAPWPCNDMVVAADGTAYVGHFGYDRQHGTTPPAPASVLRVRPDGRVDVAADELYFPNGMVITPDGATLVVAESGAHRLTAFAIGSGGSLSQRRIVAELDAPNGGERGRPDGICLAPDGSLWVADPSARRVVNVDPSGAIVRTLTIDGQAPLAPVLDDAGERLFVASGAVFDRAEAQRQRTGRITVFQLS